MKEAEILGHFVAKGQPLPEYQSIQDEEGEVFVAKSGTGKAPSIVFVHGSPGSWDNFAHMLSDAKLNSQYTVVAVDRPGFGKTQPRGPEPSLETQARRIKQAVEKAGVPLPAVWVGHSLGGPVIARLAVDSPDAVAGLLLVAPSVDPALEKRRWYNWLAKFPLVKWGLSRAWRNSNEEIFPLREELEQLAERLAEIQVPTIVLQGDADRLVDPRNADFVEREFVNAVVELRILEGVDHFIPWTHAAEMREAAIDLADGRIVR